MNIYIKAAKACANREWPTEDNFKIWERLPPSVFEEIMRVVPCAGSYWPAAAFAKLFGVNDQDSIYWFKMKGDTFQSLQNRRVIALLFAHHYFNDN